MTQTLKTVSPLRQRMLDDMRMRQLAAEDAGQLSCFNVRILKPPEGKARQPYEFGIRVSLAIREKQGLIVGAQALPGNPLRRPYAGGAT
jgi:hypothetical protein